jgi:hypothetical protein
VVKRWSADAQPSSDGGARTSLRSLLAHPAVLILIVTAGVAAANLTWLDPVTALIIQPHLCFDGSPSLGECYIPNVKGVCRLCMRTLFQVLGPHCEAIGFSVPGIGLLFGFQSAIYAVSSPLAG